MIGRAIQNINTVTLGVCVVLYGYLVVIPQPLNAWEPEERYSKLRSSTDYVCAFAKEWKWKMKQISPKSDRSLGDTARLCGFMDD